jgi:hypothetical protein
MADWAAQQRATQARANHRFTKPSSELLEYFCQLNPSLLRPDWLSPIAERFDRALLGEPVRACFSAPPQHGKTEICKAGLARIIETYPDRLNGYISYSATRSGDISKQIRKLVSERGIITEGARNNWRTEQGGGLIAVGIDGGITGYPVNGIVVLDDLLKNAKEARSGAIRDSKVEDLRMSVLTRLHPGIAAMNVATRWHPKDPSGVMISEGWENVNLAAIAEEGDVLGRKVGEALAPKIRPIEFLLQQKRDLTEVPFAAMYQGRPRPRGGAVFHDPTFYTERPKEGYVVGFGVDLAYTAKSNADWSVCLELWRVGQAHDREAKFYIIGVDRAQVEAPSFALTLKARTVRRPGAKMLWRASGTEKGAAQFINSQGIPLKVDQPPGDKFVASTAVAAAWNEGRVLLPDPDKFPECNRWLVTFLSNVADFRGEGDEVDDEIDALANAHHVLTSKPPVRGVVDW